mgnify:CR=1 FL=1
MLWIIELYEYQLILDHNKAPECFHGLCKCNGSRALEATSFFTLREHLNSIYFLLKCIELRFQAEVNTCSSARQEVWVVIIV